MDGGVRFAVWAPNATYVSVVGDFNNWDVAADTLSPVDATGIWEGIALGAAVGDRYKFHLDGREKADPMAFQAEVPPKTASVVFAVGARLAGRRTGSPGDANKNRSTGP